MKKKLKILGNSMIALSLVFCFVSSPVNAAELPIDPATEDSATVSNDVDSATNRKPHMSTDFFMYIPPDPDTDVGLIEIDRPGSDEKYGNGNIHKPFPQTGGASEDSLSVDNGTIEKTIISSDSPDRFLWDNGHLYILKNVSNSVDPKSLTETKTFTDLTEKEVPETIEIKHDGFSFVLSLRDVQYQETIPTIEGTLDHGYTLSEPKAPAEKEITYTNPDNGMAMTISAPLVSTEKIEDFSWHPVEFPIRYYGQPNFEIFQLDDTFIPYQADAPYWSGMDSLVFRHLDLSPKQWRITGSEWLSDWKGEPITGYPVRYGVLHGEMYGAHWESHYSVDDTAHPTYTATATYVSDFDSPVVSATYTAFVTSPIIATTIIGVLLILIFVIVLLFLLKRKREDRNGKCNTGNPG